MCDIALHWCNVFLMSVIGVIEWAPVGLGKRMGILGLVQAHRLARRGGGSIDAHNATTAKLFL